MIIVVFILGLGYKILFYINCMTVSLKIPDLSKQLYENDVLKSLNDNWHDYGYDWMAHQLEYVNDVYEAFKDHTKFMIVMYLINKTLSFYSRSYLILCFDDYYLQKTLEIEKFNVIDISKELLIPKETARRKIKELENDGIIKRDKKKLIIDRTAFPFFKPIKAIPRIARFLSKFSKVLSKDKLLDKEFQSVEIEKKIKLNFTHIWKSYYELQLNMIKNWNIHFRDFTTWHVYGTIAASQGYAISKEIVINKSRKNFNELLVSGKYFRGINAMSVSELTGIPRATVVRKLNLLIKSKYLVINKKKQYFTSGEHVNELTEIQSKVIKNLSIFITKVMNSINLV